MGSELHLVATPLFTVKGSEMQVTQFNLRCLIRITSAAGCR